MNTQFLKTPEGTLAYDDTRGNGEVLLCIPGMGDLRGQYRHLVPELARAGYRVITLDIRGHGESSTGWTEYTAEAVTRDVFALLDHLNLQNVTLMGNSFAARSVLYAAKQAPERIKRLVMLGPVVLNQTLPGYMNLILKMAFAGPWNTAFWMMYWQSLFPAKKPADHAQYTAKLRQNIQQKGQMDALKAYMAPSRINAEALLPDIKTPALVIMGTKDPDFKNPALEAQTLAEKLRAELMLVQGSGHYPHTEFPEQVAPRILQFLKGQQ
ncbi:alpha/beta fold hydrolase [Deinococcus roseus]|uniref:Hydrolase n=1 Tax=Deinococcus roseus TaxID=392414 RepID=A0ABQ2D557_9DEIO|nr:alpha/beta hydrolase [Deinococcus roseus]GGJ46337.1 hydrolase [Deinococcus roseus]